MEFLGNVFTNFIFEKLLLHEVLMTEELQLPVTIKRSFLSSYKLIERYRQRRLLQKQILCQSYFTFWIIFTKWIWFANSSQCFSDGNVWLPGQRAETRERIASESLQKTRTKLYDVAGHSGRVKTIVTNHSRKLVWSRIHKAAERITAVRINSDKLTDTNF